VTPVEYKELSSSRTTEKSESIRKRVIQARKVQAERFEDNENVYCNAQMGSKTLREICKIDDTGKNLLKVAMERLNLSARAYDRILKVARTIADMEGSENIQNQHLAEAIQFRSLDRETWMG
jgi:magnesium chelatase family protein